ncbi:hypothetical protein ScoT_59770 [Streptomyces albidoflavus]|uniref:Uncharacterized protein n=1 Tax=Streptomyces albidoflavus TaxID=1886 RepID=A0AA37FGW5_9ACTN|nr:hypothetical protein ScoT_59770 [Streptomyces albidoflavus]
MEDGTANAYAAIPHWGLDAASPKLHRTFRSPDLRPRTVGNTRRLNKSLSIVGHAGPASAPGGRDIQRSFDRTPEIGPHLASTCGGLRRGGFDTTRAQAISSQMNEK